MVIRAVVLLLMLTSCASPTGAPTRLEKKEPQLLRLAREEGFSYIKVGMLFGEALDLAVREFDEPQYMLVPTVEYAAILVASKSDPWGNMIILGVVGDKIAWARRVLVTGRIPVAKPVPTE